MTAPTPTPAETLDAVRRLSALRLLDARKERLNLNLKAKRKEWADKLGEKSKELHAEIEKPNPSNLNGCKQQLNLIRELYEDRKELESKKKAELDKIQASINRVDAALVELIRSDPEDLQQELELDDKTPSLNMTGDTAKVVGEAIKDLVDEGAEIAPDVEDLQAQLEDMGMAGLRLVDEEGDAED